MLLVTPRSRGYRARLYGPLRGRENQEVDSVPGSIRSLSSFELRNPCGRVVRAAPYLVATTRDLPKR